MYFGVTGKWCFYGIDPTSLLGEILNNSSQLSSLPLHILLYVNGVYYIFYFLATLAMIIYKSKLQVLSPEQAVLMQSWVLSCCVFLLYLLWFILQVRFSVIQMIFWLLILPCFSLWPFWKCLDCTWVGHVISATGM